MAQNLGIGETAKTSITLKTYIRKKESLKINQLNVETRKLEKDVKQTQGKQMKGNGNNNSTFFSGKDQ